MKLQALLFRGKSNPFRASTVTRNVVAGFSPRFHNVAVAVPRALARDYISNPSS